MKLLLALALVLVAPTAQAPRRSPVITAVVQRYGPMPMAGSGTIMFLREVTILTAKGENATLYFIHAGPDEFINHATVEAYPAIGSTCDFTTATARITGSGDLIVGDGGPGAPEGDVIVSARCKN